MFIFQWLAALFASPPNQMLRDVPFSQKVIQPKRNNIFPPSSKIIQILRFSNKFDGNFDNDLIKNFLGGYYTIEQTKSRLRIVVLNTNFMRHDFKYSQSHLSAVRQRPDGQQEYNMGYHRKHYHQINEEHNNNNNYNRFNKDRIYGSHSNSDEARLNLQNGASENGAIVSALSVSHESEKQWEWLEDTLAKSNRNKETVSKYIMLKH